MGGVEPYKSNLDKFNFWLVNRSYTDTTTAAQEFPQISTCGKLPHTLRVYLYNDQATTQVGWGWGDSMNGLNLLNLIGEIGIYKRDQQNNENDSLQYVFIHELGHFFGMNHFNAEQYPTAANTYADAKNYWGSYIGQGCGNSSVVDCQPTCLESNQCEASDYETEIGIFTQKEELCFDSNDAPLKDCEVLISKAHTSDFHYRKISFLASEENECQSSQKNCVYFKNSHYNFFDKDNNQQFICDHESVFVDNGQYIYNCIINYPWNYQIQRFGNMTAAKYNPLYIDYICEKMQNELGDDKVCSIRLPHIELPITAPKIQIGEPVNQP